ncbi:MAG: hypothetical protein GXP33_07835 [Spirochaetes bacterium]|nr:hypothetical protein [Spirochaetota bacterium]
MTFVLLLCFLFSVSFSETAEASDIITPADFYAQYSSALDSFSRLDEFSTLHRSLKKKLSIQGFFAFPTARYLAETNYGLIDAVPSNNYMGLILDILDSAPFRWELDFMTGLLTLSPYSQTKDEQGNTIYDYTPIYNMQALLINRFRLKIQRLGINLKLNFGWLHEEKSQTSDERFLIKPGKAVVRFTFNPLEDMLLFSSNIGSLLFNMIIERELKTLGFGKEWNLFDFKRFFTGLYYNKYSSLFSIGPNLEAKYAFFSGAFNFGFIPGAFAVPADSGTLPVTASSLIEAEYPFLERLTGGRITIPLKAGINLNYNGLLSIRDQLRFGWDIKTGLILKPEKKYFFMAFNMDIDISVNYPKNLVIMPVYDKPVVFINFGFHFF